MENTTRKLVSTKEMLSVLGISETTLWTLKKKGKIPFVNFGGVHRYEVDEVIKALSVNGNKD